MQRFCVQNNAPEFFIQFGKIPKKCYRFLTMNINYGKPHPGIRRRYFESGSAVLPDGVQLVGRYESRQASPLPRHRHPGVFEIKYVSQGTLRYRLNGGDIEIHAGELHICRPGEPHGGANNRMPPCLCYWLEVMPERLLPDSETARIFASLPSGKLVPPDRRLAMYFERLFDECASQRPDRLNCIAGWVRLLLVDIGRECRARPVAVPAGQPYSEPVRAVIAAMRQHVADAEPLEQLLAAGRLSPSAIFERFRQETGHTPNEFRLQLKIERSLELLRDPSLSITAVAFRLGFSSSQYFATVFRKITGYSPRRWRDRLATLERLT